MAFNEYAAFDLIFWLHHASVREWLQIRLIVDGCYRNIDRIIAIWQALNPKKRFKGQPLRGGPTCVNDHYELTNGIQDMWSGFVSL